MHGMSHAPAEHVCEQLLGSHHVGLRVGCASDVAGRTAVPHHEEIHDVLERNPEGAAPRGKWADTDFLEAVSEMNPDLNDTQFADYHGHGWNFRAVCVLY